MKQFHPIIKSVTVTILATLLAYFLGLTNYLTAGVIALISIQKTKTLSIKIAIKRSILVLISIIFASILFVLIGYNLYAYSIFILFIIIFSYSFNLKDGTIPSVVIVTQLLVHGLFSFHFTLETLIMYVIAISTALLFNIFYPSASMISLNRLRHNLDDTLRKQIINIQNKIKYKENSCTKTNFLETEIESILEKIEQVTGDLLMRNHQDILMYSTMRNKQFDILKGICSQSNKLTTHYPQTKIIEEYLGNLAMDIGVKNLAYDHLIQVEDLLSNFKKDSLPKTRDEFEHRAILYHIMQEIKLFLILKNNYHNLNLND